MNHGDNEKYSPWITFQVILWTVFGLLFDFLLPFFFLILEARLRLSEHGLFCLLLYPLDIWF